MMFLSSIDPMAALLMALVFLPLLVGLAFFFLPLKAREANFLGLVTVTLVFLGSLFLWRAFIPLDQGFAFYSTMPFGLQSIGANFEMGLNAVSMPLFFLAAFVGCAAGFFAASSAHPQKNFLWAFLLLTLGGILGGFASTDLFYAFLFHEVALLPTLMSIMVFGGIHRRQAAFQSGLFMLGGSLILLVGLIAFKFSLGLGSFSLLEWHTRLSQWIGPAQTLAPLGLVVLGAAILSGLWPFYSWVPKLLTQAPAPIAMMQGGVIKFFGIYFLLQGFASVLPAGLADSRTLISVLCVANILFVGLSAFAQTNFLKLIAYAAVMHMGTLFLALNAHNVESLGGAVVTIVGSGLATALLIMLAQALQQRTHTLQISEVSGLRKATPQLALFLMIAVMALLALPAFITFLGEFAILMGLIKAQLWAVVAVLAGLVLVAGFGLRALGQMLMNAPKGAPMADLTLIERFCAWILTIPLILFALMPGILVQPLDQFFRNLL